MKAVLLTEYGGLDKLKFVMDAPDPQIADDEILVAATATSINPIDWKVRSGAAAARMPQTFPAILGRDLSGVVRAVGTQVRSFKPGDKVLAFTSRTYAELVAVKESAVAHVPDGVDLVKIAAYPLACLTGDQLVREAAKVQKDQTVIVTGAVGSIGRAAVHTAKKLGARVIAAVRTSQEEEAKTLEPYAVLAMDDEAEVAKLGFVDAIADCIGAPTTPLLARVKEGGVVGTVVTPPPDMTLHPHLQFNKIMTHPDASKLREFADDVRDGRFELPIERMMPLEEVAEAQAIAEKGGVGKIVMLIL